MKKYTILETIGTGLSGIGLISLMLFSCIDIESIETGEILKAYSLMLISVGLMLFGQLLVYVDTVEGIVLSALVVIGAWLYKALQRPRKALRSCYEIKTECGSYKRTYKRCKHRYELYLDSLYNVENEEEEKYEQAKRPAASSSRL